MADKQKADISAKNLFEWAKRQFDLHSNPKEMVVTIPQYDSNGNLVNMRVDNFSRLKAKLFRLFSNAKGVLVGRVFFKSHSFEARRVTNQGGTTLKSGSIFMTHAGEQNTLNAVIRELMRYRWKKSNIKDVGNEDNIVSADNEVIISPNNQKGDRKYSQMYRFIYNQFIVPGAINAGSYIRTKLYFIVYAKSPRVWLQDSKRRNAGLLYSPNADARDSYGKRITLAQYGVDGKGWQTYLELFSGKGRINGRDIVTKEVIRAVNKNYTAYANDLIIVDARTATRSSTAKKIYLPKSPKNGDVVRVKGRYSRGYVYVYGNGKKIETRDNTYFYGYQMREFTFYGEWLMTAKV